MDQLEALVFRTSPGLRHLRRGFASRAKAVWSGRVPGIGLYFGEVAIIRALAGMPNFRDETTFALLIFLGEAIYAAVVAVEINPWCLRRQLC
jgi:hypothetical protein